MKKYVNDNPIGYSRFRDLSTLPLIDNNPSFTNHKSNLQQI